MDLELNRLTKALFLAQVVLSVVMVALQGFVGPWFRNLFRFVVLFSYIIPIRYLKIIILIYNYQKYILQMEIFWFTLFSPYMYSLRVNLDMGKAAYGWLIMKDENIPGTVVRTSTIPEELGRLVYLLTDKTGKFSNRWKWVTFIYFLRIRLKFSYRSIVAALKNLYPLCSVYYVVAWSMFTYCIQFSLTVHLFWDLYIYPFHLKICSWRYARTRI